MFLVAFRDYRSTFLVVEGESSSSVDFFSSRDMPYDSIVSHVRTIYIKGLVLFVRATCSTRSRTHPEKTGNVVSSICAGTTIP